VAAWRLAEERFSDRRVVSRILSLYAELLREKGLNVPDALGRDL
jgi:hypothetical protein